MMIVKKFSENYLVGILVAAVLAFSVFTANLQAQKSKIVESGVVSGVPYASTDFENINLTNGNLNFSFPLASLQGRGAAGFTYSLKYNSKLWRTVSNPVYNVHYTPNPTYQEFLANNFEAGWQDEAVYYPAVRDRFERLDYPTGNLCELNVRWQVAYRWKVEMNFPDGGKVEFRPAGYSDILPGETSAEAQGYFNVKTNGSVRSVTGSTDNCIHSDSTPSGARMTYYSSDGSGMRLTYANAEALGYVWELSMPDGSRVVQLSDRQRVIDGNGNYVESATITLPDGSQAQGWVDQVGRYIARKNNLATNEDTYYQLGYDGALLTWKVKWKNVYVRKNYTTTCNSCGFNVRGPVTDQIATMEFRVVERIELPTQLGGLVYTFDYYAKDVDDANESPGWGEVKSVTLPTEAKITYSYKLSTFQTALENESPEIESGEIYLRVDQILERAGTINKKKLTYTESYDGESPSEKIEFWGYGIGRTSSSVVAPDGGTTTQYYWDIVNNVQRGGQVYKIVNPDGTIIERVWGNNLPTGITYGSPNHLNPYIQKEITTIHNSSGSPVLIGVKDYAIDGNGNQTEVKEYDFLTYSSNAITRDNGVATGVTGATVKRKTFTDYYNSINTNSANAYWSASAPALRNLQKFTEIQTAGGTPVSRSEFYYDDKVTITSGNLTETKVWDSNKNGSNQTYSNPLSTNNSISTTTAYDPYGNPTLTIDGNLRQTQMTYGAVGGYTGLYPTQTISAYGTAIQQTVQTEYDFYTGLPKKVTTLGNTPSENIISETEYDAFGRPILVKSAVGTAQEIWTQTDYNDVLRRVIFESDLETKGDGKKIAVRHFDQLGRVRLSRTIENAATEDPTNEQHGIKAQTRYKYTSSGEYTLTSNPYRAATSAQAANEPTMGWKVEFEDKAGNLSTTETFGGTALPAPWASNSNSTGLVKEEEDANATTVTDEAGKKRRTVEDALGRLMRVDEPDSNNNLGSIDIPIQPTYYTYDLLNNLTTVQQSGNNNEQCGSTTTTCSQTRSFTYSSLSRLLTAMNPESGTFQYTYDNNGNLRTKKDARNITTTYTYDALNRVTFRDYSNSTPDITYTYDDPSVPKSKGKLTRVYSTVSEMQFTAFDEQGRVLGSRQVTDGKSYDFGYTYYLNGALKTQTYPSTKVVKYDYNNDGDLSQVSNNQTQKYYANSFSYNAHGKVERMRLGNGNWETTKFNSALQITEVGLGHSATDSGLWKVNYEYGEWENGAINTKWNNGNLLRQTITVPTIAATTGFTAIQTYNYDKFDRLKSAVETVGGVEKWKQTFDYDRFGNKRLNTGATTLQSSESSAIPKVANPEALPSNNQYKQDQDNDGINDYLYDPSGNITKNAQERNFTFDAENRQLTAIGSSLSMSYAYDGNDKRVKSVNAITNQTTIFVYDADGDLAAEYTINVVPPTISTVSYLTEDALGSVRVVTDSAGDIKARRDFLPFGEEIFAGIGSRNTNQKYSSNTDDVRKKFATYQRDAETGLDYAQSRYYSPMQGRFTSPDEFKGGPDELFDFEEDAANNPTFYADLTNPQSLNKYQYTYNNPYKYNDPDGHCPVGCIFVRPIMLPRPVVAPRPTTIVPRPVTAPIEGVVGRLMGAAPRVAAAKKPPYVPPLVRNVGRNFPTRKLAREASSSGRNRPKPQPPKSKPKKRANWERNQKKFKPEKHPDAKKREYRRKHFHDRRKPENNKKNNRKPGERTNNHNYYPKRF